VIDPANRYGGSHARIGQVAGVLSGDDLRRFLGGHIWRAGLRQQILCRDGWRCQLCGSISNLEAHHREFRSHSGADTEENLITLCTACHGGVHELR